MFESLTGKHLFFTSIGNFSCCTQSSLPVVFSCALPRFCLLYKLCLDNWTYYSAPIDFPWTNNPGSSNLTLHAACCSLQTMSVTLCWTKWTFSDALFLCGDWNQTLHFQCCLIRGTQTGIISSFDLLAALFLMWLIFTSIRTICSLMIILLSSRTPDLLPLSLLSLLSQALDFVELHDTFARPVLQLTDPHNPWLPANLTVHPKPSSRPLTKTCYHPLWNIICKLASI